MLAKEICAVIVTYNRLNLLKECLDAIAHNPEVKHVVIVNNNSSDGTEAFLAQLDPANYVVINSKANLGGAGGFARGMAEAYAQTDDSYFWIMDDDTIPQLNSAAALLAKADLLEDQFGFLASDVRWIDGRSSNMPWPAMSWPERIQEGLVAVTRGTFVSILVTRQTVKKYGIPTKELFIWGDDTEYTTRITQSLPSYFVIDSHVVHKSPSNLTDITLYNDSADRLGRYYYLYRNLMYISKRYQGKGAASRLFVSQILMGIVALGRANDHRWKRFTTVIRGTFAGISFNPAIQRVDSQPTE